MSFSRARAFQGLQNGLRQGSARPALRSNAFQRAQMQAKRFASSEHGHKQSSDLPWLIGSLTVTPPAVWYLWPAASSDDHHDHHGEEDKHEHFEQSKLGEDEKDGEYTPEEKRSGDDDEPIKEIEAESAESADKSTPKEPGAEKEDKDGVPAEGEAEAKPANGNGNVEGVNFKGNMKEDSEGASHSVKIESDSKGGVKKRLDSGLAKNLGPGHEQEGSDRDTTTTDGKQKGLSNTQTRHSEPIHESPEKSKKPDGTPETSKHIGTVDPSK